MQKPFLNCYCPLTTTEMSHSAPLASHHGVMMSVAGVGIMIQGRPGIGKSSIALDLIQRGHKLIADDLIDCYPCDAGLFAQAPAKLVDRLHSRELGLIPISATFGAQSWQQQTAIDLIVHIEATGTGQQLFDPQTTDSVADYTLPCWHLFLDNPVPVSQRIELLARLFTTHQKIQERRC